VKNSRVLWIYRFLVLCSVTDTIFGVRKRNTGWGSPLAVVVRDDLNVVVSPDTDTTVWDAMRTHGNGM
jgi:hypothetical protein